jgi:hypothetical protein
MKQGSNRCITTKSIISCDDYHHLNHQGFGRTQPSSIPWFEPSLPRYNSSGLYKVLTSQNIIFCSRLVPTSIVSLNKYPMLLNCLVLLPSQILHLPFLLLNKQFLNHILVWTIIFSLVLELSLCMLPSNVSLSLCHLRRTRSLWASNIFLCSGFINIASIG